MCCILQDPKSNPSFSVLPELLLDYDFETDEARIWVKSAVSDFKYDNITIEMSYDDQKQTIIENNTYCTSTSTLQKVFNLKIILVSEEKIFEFDCKIDIYIMREDLIIITKYDKTTDD